MVIYEFVNFVIYESATFIKEFMSISKRETKSVLMQL